MVLIRKSIFAPGIPTPRTSRQQTQVRLSTPGQVRPTGPRPSALAPISRTIGRIPGAKRVGRAATAAFGPVSKALTFTSDTIEKIARKAGVNPKLAFAAGMILDPLNYLTFGAGFVPKVGVVALTKLAPKIIKTARVAKGAKYSRGVSKAIKSATTGGGEIHLTRKAGKELARLRSAGKFSPASEQKFYGSILNRAFVRGEKGLVQSKGVRVGAGIPFTPLQKTFAVRSPKFISKSIDRLVARTGNIPGIKQGIIKANKVTREIFSSPVERLPAGAEDLVDKSFAFANREKEWWEAFAKGVKQIKDPVRLQKIRRILSGDTSAVDVLATTARKKLNAYADEAVKAGLIKKEDLKANWLPKLYDQFLKDTNLSFSSSNLLSPEELGRLIKPKKLSKVRRLALGEVKDAEFLASVGGSQISQLLIKTKLLKTLAKKYGYTAPDIRKVIGKETVKIGKIPKLVRATVDKRYAGLKAGQTSERNFLADIIGKGKAGKMTDSQFEVVGRELLRGSREVMHPLTGEKLLQVPKTDQYGALAGAYAPEALMEFFGSQLAKPKLPGPLNIFAAFANNKHFAIITNFFKRGKTILNPAQLFRNMMSNQVLSFMEEPASFKAFFKAAQALKQGRKNKWYKLAAEDGLLDSTFFGGELNKYYNEISKLNPSKGNTFVGGLSNVWESVVKKGGDIQQGSENLSKLQLYIYALERGASREAAKRIAERAIFAYNKVSPTIRVMRQSGIPFMTFAVKAAKQTARTAVVAPGRLAAFPKLEKTWNEVVLGGIDASDEKYLPEWMREMIRTPWQDENGNPLFFSLKYLYPWGTFFEELGTGSSIPQLPFGLGAHPILTSGGELAFNRHSFFGTDIRDKGAAPFEQAQQVVEHITRQFGPTFPTRFISQLPISQQPSRRGLREEALSSVGVKLDPFRVEEERVKRIKEVSGPRFDLDNRLRTLDKQLQQGRISPEEYRKRRDRAIKFYEEKTKGAVEQFGK